jgi:hypothetical protein
MKNNEVKNIVKKVRSQGYAFVEEYFNKSQCEKYREEIDAISNRENVCLSLVTFAMMRGISKIHGDFIATE